MPVYATDSTGGFRSLLARIWAWARALFNRP